MESNSFLKISRQALLNAYILLIFVSSALPSGEFYSIPVKQISFLFVFLCILVLLIIKNDIAYALNFKSLFYLLLITLILAYLAYALIISNGSIKIIFSDFQIIFLFLVFFIYTEFVKMVLNKSWDDMFIHVLRSTFWGVTFFSLLKTIIIFLLLFEIIDYSYVESVIFEKINYKPVGLAIELLGSRFSFLTLDLLTCIVFVLFIYKEEYFKTSKTTKYLFYLVFFISIFSAYSRFLFGFILFFFVSSCLLNRKYKSLVYSMFLLIAIGLLNIETLLQIIDNRFLGQEGSDSDRIDMFRYLIANWEENLLLGSGLGSNVPGYIRDTMLPFSYEMQLLSIIMRLGLSVVFFLAIIEIALLISIIKNKSNDLIFVFLIFNIILLGAMTNQYLLSSQSNIIFLILYLIVKSSRHKLASLKM